MYAESLSKNFWHLSFFLIKVENNDKNFLFQGFWMVNEIEI